MVCPIWDWSVQSHIGQTKWDKTGQIALSNPILDRKKGTKWNIFGQTIRGRKVFILSLLVCVKKFPSLNNGRNYYYKNSNFKMEPQTLIYFSRQFGTFLSWKSWCLALRCRRRGAGQSRTAVMPPSPPCCNIATVTLLNRMFQDWTFVKYW